MGAQMAEKCARIGLAALLAITTTGLPTPAAAASSDEAAAARRELQAELDALFAGLNEPDAGAASDVSTQVSRSMGDLAQQAGPGTAGAAVIVTSVALVEANAVVTLTWDDVLDLEAFEVLRDGVVIGESDGVDPFVDTVPAGEPYEYEVRSTDPGLGDPIVGSSIVVVSDATRGCDFTWTGASDSDFADADNWAPIGAAPGSPRAPGAGDHVCIDSRQNTPATSTAVGVEVDRVSTDLKADAAEPRLLAVADGDLSVTTSIAGVDVEIDGGTFAPADPAFRLLTFADGVLSLTENASVSEGAEFGPGQATIRSADGLPISVDVAPPIAGTAIVNEATLTDAKIFLDGPVNLSGGSVVMSGASSIAPTPDSAATLTTLFVVADSGEATIDASMSSVMTVGDGASLTVTNHQAFANGTLPPQIALDGTLTLTQPVTQLGNVDYRSAAAGIVLNGGPANDFSGVASINDMTMNDSNDVIVRNNIQVRSLSMNNGSTFTVDGELDYTSFLVLSDATITAPTIVTTGVGAADGDIDVFGTGNRLVADVTTNGTIRLGSDPEVGTDARLNIDGGLTLGSDSFIDTNLTGSDVTGRLAVRDTATLDGGLFARVNGVLPADTDVAAVTWGAAVGALEVSLGGNTDDTTIEQKAGGVFVRRAGGSGLDVTAVAALGLLFDVELGAELQLAWPALADTDRYQVLVDGETVGEPTDTTLLVELPDAGAGDEVAFEVIAIGVEEGETKLGTLDVAIPDSICSIAWTGAIDGAWANPLNWVPTSEDAIPSPRLPDGSDEVCVDIDTNTPIVIDGDVSVDTLTDTLSAASVPVIDIVSGDVSATRIFVTTIDGRDGSITADELGVNRLTLGNAVVDASTSNIATLLVRPIGKDANDAELLGAADVDSIFVAADTSLRVEQLVSAGAAVIDLAGPMTIDDPPASIGTLFLFESGTLTLGNGGANDFSGVGSIGVLGVQDTLMVTLPDGISLGDVAIAGSVVDAVASVSVTGRLDLQDGADVSIEGDLTLGADSTTAVSSVSAAELASAVVVGDVALDGALTVDLAEAIPSDPFVSWETSTGSFDTTSLTGDGADGFELVVFDAGVAVEPAVVDAAALNVRGFDVGDGLDAVTLVLEWPTFDGAASYAVLRDGELVTEVGGPGAEVASDATSTETWSVVALDADSDELGVVGKLDVLASVNTCDLVWTGAVSNAWGDPLNWAPTFSGASVPARRAPGALDLTCVHVDENLPASITSDVEVGLVFSLIASQDGVGLADDVTVLDVVGARVDTLEGFITGGVNVTDGVVDLDAESQIAGDLVLSGATVSIAGGLTVDGAIEVVGASTSIDADPDVAMSLRADTFTVTGTSLVVDDDIAVDANRVELDDAIVGGGSTFTADQLLAVSGDNAVGGAGTSFPDVGVAAGARLVADKLGGAADTHFVALGRLDLVSVGNTIGALSIDGPDAIVTIDDGGENVLAGIASMSELNLLSASANVDDGFAVRRLDIRNGALTVEGDFDVTSIVATGTSTIDASVVQLVGDPDGNLPPGIAASTGFDGTDLTIFGDLALRSDSTIDLTVASLPTTPLVLVDGEVTLDGDVAVALDAELAPGAEQTLVAWTAATGSLTERLTGSASAGAFLDRTATGIDVRSAVPIVPTLVALGIELGEKPSTDPADVSLTWPALPGAESYEVQRREQGDETVATTTGTVSTVVAPAGETSTFTVVGLDADGRVVDTVGTLSFLGPFDGCDVVWTGADDSNWGNRFNWSTVAADGERPPEMRSPSVTDAACVGVDTNLPMQVLLDHGVDSLNTLLADNVEGGLPADTLMLDIDANFAAIGFATIASAEVSDGFLFIADGSIAGDLALDSATLEFTSSSFEIGGTLTSNGPAGRVFADRVGEANLDVGDIVVDAGALRFDGEITTTADRIQLDAAVIQGGTVTNTVELVAATGTSTAALPGLGADTITVDDGAALDIPTANRFTFTTLAVAGRLDLPAGVDSIGGLALVASSAISIDDGRENDLTGVVTIDDVTLENSTLAIGNTVAAPAILLDDSTLTVTGDLDTANVFASGTSRINATTTTLAAAGGLSPVLSTTATATLPSLTVFGDLVLASDGLVVLSLDVLPTNPIVDVLGAATLAGDVVVSTDEKPDEGAEVELVAWSNSTGTLAVTLEGSSGAELRQRDTGLFLVADGVEECGEAPDLADMNVDGCFVDEGDNTYTATRADNIDGVTIGGVVLDIPDDQTTVMIDNDEESISTTRIDGSAAPVGVSIPVTRDGTIVERLNLGIFTFDGFGLGSVIDLSLDDLFGFPTGGTPKLISGTSGWNLDVDLDLSGILRAIGRLNLSIGDLGIDAGDLSLDDLGAVFGDLTDLADLDIDWTDASTWTFSNLGIEGPSVTGEVDFDELDGGGSLSVRDLRVEGVLVSPDFDLTGVFTDTTRTWTASQPPASVLRSAEFSYTTDGEVLAAELLLGDADGESVRDSVVTWGDWLDIDGIEFEWNGIAKIWGVTGRLTEPDVAFTGSYSADADGRTDVFTLDIDGVQLGPFATFDLDLAYDGDTGAYAATALVIPDVGDPIDGSGFLRFDDGELAEVEMTFASISIGELVTMDDFAFTYVRAEGRFTLAGTLPGSGAENEVSGFLAFDDGRVREGQLRLDSLQLGPISFETFALDFTSATGNERVTEATFSGSVRAGSRGETAVGGSVEFVDGTLIDLDLDIDTIELGGVAQIAGATFSYEKVDAETARITSSGTLITSDGATDTPVLVSITVRDGEVVDGRIEADVLSFAKAIEIENFALVDSPVTPGKCASFDAPAGARQWQVSGDTTSNGNTTSVDGCLVLDGGRLVAGQLELGSIRVAELFTVDELVATFEERRDIEIENPDGGDKIAVSETEMSLEATVSIGEGGPQTVRGAAAFANGGLTAFDLAISDIELMNIVKLRDIEFSYATGAPWDRDVDTSFSLSGSVVGENTTSTFDGDLVFDSNGEVQALSIDATDVDFGLFRIDLLSFDYTNDGPVNEWALSGTVSVDGETRTISGSATIDNGRVVAADLAIGGLVIGDLAVIDQVELSYARESDGTETWSGSASVTNAGKSNEVTLEFAFDSNGSLVFGEVTIAELRWSELLVFQNILFSYQSGPDSTRWDVSGSTNIGGEVTTLGGFLELEAGRVTAGQLDISNLRIGALVTIQQLTLGAQVVGDTTTWNAVVVIDNDDNSTGTGSMAWRNGRLVSADLGLTDISFGSAFTLSEVRASFTAEEWSISATLKNAGRNNSTSITLGFDSGRLVSAAFTIDQLSFGGVVTIDALALSYSTDGGSTSWRASGTTTVGGQSTTITASFDFVGGRMDAAEITIGRLEFTEAIVIDDARLAYDRLGNASRWTLDGSFSVLGNTTTVSGFLGLEEGRIIAGDLTVDNLRIGPLTTIDEMSINFDRVANGSQFTIGITFAAGGTASGSIAWVDGVVDRGVIELGDIELGRTFQMLDAEMAYAAGAWTFDASFVSGGNSATISGGLFFDNGRLGDATLNVGEFVIAGFALSDLAIVLGDTVDLGGGTETIAEVCDVTDPGGPGSLYGISARVVNESGSDGTFGGRLRVDDGRVTDGVLCAENLDIGDIITIDELLINPTTRAEGDDVRETWAGDIDLANPDSPDDPFGAEFEWVTFNGTTQSLDITADNIGFSNLLTFEQVDFSYSRTGLGGRWAIGAELRQPGANPSVTGFIELEGRRVTAAEITIANLSFGNVVQLDGLTMTYVGRRDQSTLPAQQSDNDGTFESIPVGGCSAIPAGSNVPSGTPTTIGDEAYFRIAAQVGVGESAVAAAGSIGFVNGKMSVFDLSISCLNLGEWLSLDDVRIGLSDDGDYLFQAAQSDATDAGQRVTGRITMDDGKVAGGRLTAQNLSFGLVELRELRLFLGQQDSGLSQWGASVLVGDPDGGTSFAGGGSVQLDDGRVVGGTLELPDLPLLDLLPVENVSIGFERIVGGPADGNLRLFGDVSLLNGDGSEGGDISLRLIWSDGKLVAGTLQADAVELFGVVDGGSFFVSYDRNLPDGPPTWSGALTTEVPGESGSSIQMNFDVINGKLDSGVIGFDANNNGTIDPFQPAGSNSQFAVAGAAPASGNGEIAGFPLKALRVRYCSNTTTATFCDDLDGAGWDGRLKVEIPVESAPTLDASVTVRDGRFVRAAIDLDLDPGLHLFSGVFLESIGGALEIDPRLRFCGSVGVSVGSPTFPIASIEGTFEFSEQFSGFPFVIQSPPPVGCDQPVGPFVAPADRDADYYRFLVQAEADLFPGNPLGIDLSGTGFIDLRTNGYLGLGADVNASFWGDKLSIDGYIEGSVFDADNIDVTNPRYPNQLLTGPQAQLSAGVSATVLGVQVTSADVILNTVGWSGCVRIGPDNRFGRDLGASGYWNGGFALGCGVSRVALLVPGSNNPFNRSADTGSGLLASSSISELTAFTPTADTRFEVAAGESTLAIVMSAASGTPDTQVISPTGTVYDVSRTDVDPGVLTFTDATEQVFMITDPAAGTWTVRQVPGSPVLVSVDAYLGLPDVDVSAELQSDGDGFSFDYTLAEVDGQAVSFVERDPNGAVVNLVGRVESDPSSGQTNVRRLGDGELVVLEANRTSGATTGTLTYRSNAAAAGGEYQLVALVEQDGLPREEVVLATYEIAPATLATAPISVTATPTSEGATVMWKPPADDGGRQIMAYHVYSQRGFTVAVDADQRSVELPIPLMTPGETLEVYVRAFTAAGRGANGTATFTATSATEAAYEQTAQPLAFEIGSNQTAVPDPVPVPGPATTPTPTAPVVPDAPDAPVVPDMPTVPDTPVVPAPAPNLPTTGSGTSAPISLAVGLLLLGVALRLSGTRRRLPTK